MCIHELRPGGVFIFATEAVAPMMAICKDIVEICYRSLNCSQGRAAWQEILEIKLAKVGQSVIMRSHGESIVQTL